MSGTVRGYTLSTTTSLSFDQAVARVRDELTAEGFGVLCEIDVRATLEQKLGVDREPYVILGACNPPLAHAALEAEPELGTLLPCNVVIYEQQGETHIAAVDAERMLSIVGNDELAATATEVRRRLPAPFEQKKPPFLEDCPPSSTVRPGSNPSALPEPHGLLAGRLRKNPDSVLRGHRSASEACLRMSRAGSGATVW